MSSVPRVGEVMTPMPHSIDVDAMVAAASDLMARLGVWQLAVTSQGNVVGLITERDVQVAVCHGHNAFASLRVRDLRPAPVYASAADEPLDQVLQKVALRRLASVVVVDISGNVIGLLTGRDVCRQLAVRLCRDAQLGPSDTGEQSAPADVGSSRRASQK